MKRLLYIMTGMLWLCSCDYKDIYVKVQPDVAFDVDWRDLDAVTVCDASPVTATALFYRPDGTLGEQPLVFNVDHTVQRVSGGSYGCVLMMNESPGWYKDITFTGIGNINTLAVATGTDTRVSRYFSRAAGDAVTLEPQVVAFDDCGSYDQQLVEYRAYDKKKNGQKKYQVVCDTLCFRPVPVTEQALIVIRVKGLSNVAAASGQITGLAGTFYPGSGLRTSPVTHQFSFSGALLSSNAKDGSIVARILTFGLVNDPDSKASESSITIDVVFMLKGETLDGKKEFFGSVTVPRSAVTRTLPGGVNCMGEVNGTGLVQDNIVVDMSDVVPDVETTGGLSIGVNWWYENTIIDIGD